MERVSVYEGSTPYLIVVPHGHDDHNTAMLGTMLIRELDAYGVINRGWERSDFVDVDNSLANCNSIKHCQEDIVKDEFLDPFLKNASEILSSSHNIPAVNIFIIHGVGNLIRKKHPGLDLILGCGYGAKNQSAESGFIAHFLKNLIAQKFETYIGEKNGEYAGISKDNLNQYFHGSRAARSTQIEVIKQRRENQKICKDTAIRIAKAIGTTFKEDWSNPLGIKVPTA